MAFVSLLFLAAYAVLIMWGLGMALPIYRPSRHARQLPRMAETLGTSIDEIEDCDLAIHLPTADYCCANCTSKVACEAWLASHASAEKAPDFCPNGSYLRLAKR